MRRILLLTGATGHLGQAVARELLRRGERVRALVMPGDRFARFLPAQVERAAGDVTDADALRAFFDVPGEKRALHCAGLITIAGRPDPRVRAVNVGGTQNVLRMCARFGVEKLVYVGSVHAIPEDAAGRGMAEPAAYDPALVIGQYAKSKAEAAQSVLEAARAGLNASLALPSGLIGPYDWRGGHMTRLFSALTDGRLRAVVDGGYDFADVRDVAFGLAQCLDKGRAGESYILSGGWHSVQEMARLYCEALGKRPAQTVLPLWLARAAAPFAEGCARLRGVPALFTGYSLHTLQAPARFLRDKAMRELDYTVRPIADTLRDMAVFAAGRAAGAGRGKEHT